MIEVFIILGLIFLNGLFAMAEMALISSRKTRLELQAHKGDSQAKKALDLANYPDKFLSTVQIGITLITILVGIFSETDIKEGITRYLTGFDWLQPYVNSTATVINVFIITYLSLISELTGKRVGLSNPEGIAKFAATPMIVISKIAYPFVWFLSASTNFISGIFKIRPNDSSVTEEEIKAIISEGTETGAIEQSEQAIIERVFHLGDRNITSLMTHRSDIVWMDVNCTVGDLKKKMTDTVHSTYPICEGIIDNIRGLVSIKDVMLSTDDTPLQQLMKKSYYVPENNTVYQVLEKFKQANTSTCFIVDEYGSMEGMITLNDILEAIVGDIISPDADDYEIVKRDDGTFLVDAQLPFYDFLSHFEKTEFMNEGEHDFNTLAGFILHQLQTIPQTGDKLEWEGFEFEIMDMDGNRIDKVLLTTNNPTASETAQNNQ